MLAGLQLAAKVDNGGSTGALLDHYGDQVELSRCPSDADRTGRTEVPFVGLVPDGAPGRARHTERQR
ncbi:hypothetical protein ACQP00_00375 [Dactylosporangium sp. CS-047395]|uniref:hypothetical protein n=1 Tax=Dactylosporangium sp. CS-047395 TaxID=3239936 RepID=UPI003D8ECE99